MNVSEYKFLFSLGEAVAAGLVATKTCWSYFYALRRLLTSEQSSERPMTSVTRQRTSDAPRLRVVLERSRARQWRQRSQQRGHNIGRAWLDCKAGGKPAKRVKTTNAQKSKR
eukprot:5616-Heterococcus_DN1.PRE.6